LKILTFFNWLFSHKNIFDVYFLHVKAFIFSALVCGVLWNHFFLFGYRQETRFKKSHSRRTLLTWLGNENGMWNIAPKIKYVLSYCLLRLSSIHIDSDSSQEKKTIKKERSWRLTVTIIVLQIICKNDHVSAIYMFEFHYSWLIPKKWNDGFFFF